MQVVSVAIYLRDTYDFIGDQFLGVWSANGVNRSRIDEMMASQIRLYSPIAVDKADYEQAETGRWYSVSNADFGRYRGKAGKGHDYFNVSDVRVVRLPLPIDVTF